MNVHRPLRAFSLFGSIGVLFVAGNGAVVGCSKPTHEYFDDSDAALRVTLDGGADSSRGSAGARGDGGASAGGGKTAVGGAGGGGPGGGSAAGGAAASGGTGTSSGGAPAGGYGGAGGSNPGLEDCFDGVDNDANAKVDCEDPACAPYATCVAEPDNFALGLVVDKTAACPSGTTETKIFRGLSGGTTCTGCACAANPIKCEADLFVYPSAADCSADTAINGGTLAKHLAEDCSDNVTILNSNIYTNGGFRAGPVQVIQSCTQSGTGAVSPAQWSESKKFCAYGKTGGGCAVGQKCVPSQTDPAAQCALSSGSALCDGFQSVKNDWFTGYDDKRSCSACDCTAFGGACQYPQIIVGTDYTCDPGFTLTGSDKNCQGEYVPAVGIRANLVPSQCTPSSKLTGELSPHGQQTLCCVPGP